MRCLHARSRVLRLVDRPIARDARTFRRRSKRWEKPVRCQLQRQHRCSIPFRARQEPVARLARDSRTRCAGFRCCKGPLRGERALFWRRYRHGLRTRIENGLADHFSRIMDAEGSWVRHFWQFVRRESRPQQPQWHHHGLRRWDDDAVTNDFNRRPRSECGCIRWSGQSLCRELAYVAASTKHRARISSGKE